MPSRSKKSKKTSPLEKHFGFFPLLTLIFILWLLYRNLFQFPVWFDETVGKAVFFGLPVWVYIALAGSKSIADTFAPHKLKSGLLLGLAFGGIFGFVASLVAVLQRGGVVGQVWLFSADLFWGEFILAMMTAFWETLLFFSFAMTVIQEKFTKWKPLQHALLAATIFLIFHVPNTVIRFDLSAIAPQLALMFLFGLGQAYLFTSRRNAYTLILSHTIWGMVLLTHFW